MKVKKMMKVKRVKRVKMSEDIKTTILAIVCIAIMAMLTASIKAQDTICMMITTHEIIEFNYQTSEVLDRKLITSDITLHVATEQVLCLHLLDTRRRFRTVSTVYGDGTHSHETLPSKDAVYYSAYGYGPMVVSIGAPRVRRRE